jgi:hypothetical protein
VHQPFAVCGTGAFALAVQYLAGVSEFLQPVGIQPRQRLRRLRDYLSQFLPLSRSLHLSFS